MLFADEFSCLLNMGGPEYYSSFDADTPVRGCIVYLTLSNTICRLNNEKRRDIIDV